MGNGLSGWPTGKWKTIPYDRQCSVVIADLAEWKFYHPVNGFDIGCSGCLNIEHRSKFLTTWHHRLWGKWPETNQKMSQNSSEYNQWQCISTSQSGKRLATANRWRIVRVTKVSIHGMGCDDPVKISYHLLWSPCKIWLLFILPCGGAETPTHGMWGMVDP